VMLVQEDEPHPANISPMIDKTTKTITVE